MASSSEKPGAIPLRKPVQEFTTPDASVGFFTELVDKSDAGYRVPYRGMPYVSMVGGNSMLAQSFPDLVFLRESRFRESDHLVMWTWGTSPHAEDTYNAEVTYSGEAPECPIFTRIYTVRRSEYDASAPIAIGTPLKTIIALNVSDAGQGYKDDGSTKVTISNGATARAIIGNGELVGLVLTSQGSEVTSAPTVTIEGTGNGAVAAAVIQPQTATLIGQKKSELPETHPLRNEYVLVTRVYETIPGPVLGGHAVSSQFGGGVLDTVHQVVDPTTTVAGGLNVVSAKVDADSEGKSVLQTAVLPVGQVWPTLIEQQTDPETGLVIKITKQVVDPASSAPAASQQTLVERQAIDKWKSIQIISTRWNAGELPAPEVFTTSVAISMPNFLEEVGVEWEAAAHAGLSNNVLNSPYTYPEAGWSSSIGLDVMDGTSGAGWVKIREGYRGQAQAQVTRTYFNGPPNNTHTPHLFLPVMGQLIIHSNSQSVSDVRGQAGSGGDLDSVSSSQDLKVAINGNVQHMNFGPVEHNNPDLTVIGNDTNYEKANSTAVETPTGFIYGYTIRADSKGTVKLVLPSSSTPLTGGATFLHSVDVRKWRFGIWVVEEVVATVPTGV